MWQFNCCKTNCTLVLGGLSFNHPPITSIFEWIIMVPQVVRRLISNYVRIYVPAGLIWPWSLSIWINWKMAFILLLNLIFGVNSSNILDKNTIESYSILIKSSQITVGVLRIWYNLTQNLNGWKIKNNRTFSKCCANILAQYKAIRPDMNPAQSLIA